jgi:hypothetical protein
MLFGEKGPADARHGYLYSLPEPDAQVLPGPTRGAPVRLFSGEVLTSSLVPERLEYDDDVFPPHRTGSYAAYWGCISWIPVTKGGSCLCEHGPSASFEHDAEKAGAVVWLGK